MRKAVVRMTAQLAVSLLATAAAAQSTYFAPGTLGERTETSRERVMRAYQDARWSLGPVELEPQLSIGDLSYVSNIYSSAEEDAVSDLRGGAQAGLRGFFNLGPNVVVSPFGGLSYAWWRDQEELRVLSESFGVQMFGDFNRLQVQLQAGRVEAQRNLSSEVEVPVNPRNDRAELDLDVDIRGPLRFFAAASRSEIRYSGAVAEQEVPGLTLSTIDSDGERVNAGLSYELSNGLRLGLGYLRTETRYLDDPEGRSQQGEGPLLRIELEGPRLSISLDAARRDIEFLARQADNQRRQTDGLAVVGWQWSERLSSRVYGGAQLNASALDSQAIFESRRTGGSVSYEVGPRRRFGVFYESGQDEYATAASDLVTRRDDFSSYGASFRQQLSRRLVLELGFLDSRRDSSDPAFDREISSLNFRLNLGGNLLPWQP